MQVRRGVGPYTQIATPRPEAPICNAGAQGLELRAALALAQSEDAERKDAAGGVNPEPSTLLDRSVWWKPSE